jgi:hypothetical protein
LTKALALLLLVGEKVAAFFRFVTGLLGGFDNTIKLAIFAVTALGIAFAALTAIGLTSMLIFFAPVILIIGKIALAIFALILIIEDLYVWMQGGDSFIGGWLDKFENVKKVLDGVASVIAGFLSFVVGLFTGNGNLIIAATDEMIQGILNVLTGAATLIAKAIAAPFQLGWELIKKTLPEWAVNFLRGTLQGGTTGFGGATPGIAGAGLAGGFSAGAFARPSVVAGASNSTSQNAATVNNYVTVPPGTPQQQVDAIRSAVGQVVDERLRRSFDHVNQDNPEVD